MDVQLFVDGMLPPLKKFEKSIATNKRLSEDNKEKLRKIVIKIQKSNTLFNICVAIIDIRYSFSGYLKKGRRKPFLLRQVIFYLIVQSLNYKKVSQEDVIDFLRSKGVSISHNYFSREIFTPKQYYDVYKYKIPKSVIGYMGAKKDEFGIAIKNLVYQAGEYDIFCDIFGGSGAASLAVNKIPGKKYVYNELNKSVYNLIYVVKDDKLYLDLIDALHALQNYIADGGQQYGAMDLEKVTKDFLANANNEDDQNILSTSLKDFETEGISVVRAAFTVYADIVNQPNRFSVKLNNVKYTKQELLELFDIPGGASQDIIDMKILNFSIRHYGLLEAYNQEVLGQKKFIWESQDEQTIEHTELSQKYTQGRVYSYCIYFFETILKQSNNIPNDRIMHAVAEVFRHYFAFSDRTIKSSVLSAIRNNYKEKNKKVIERFIKKDFKTVITTMHRALGQITLENKYFEAILDKYNKNKNVLYYADLPYIATSGYKDEANNVGLFTENDMENLIRSLVKSGHKFIFSCRAVKEREKNGGCVDTPKILKSNLKLLQYMYNVFKEYIDSGEVDTFYVLAVEGISDETSLPHPELKVGTLPEIISSSGLLFCQL